MRGSKVKLADIARAFDPFYLPTCRWFGMPIGIRVWASFWTSAWRTCHECSPSHSRSHSRTRSQPPPWWTLSFAPSRACWWAGWAAAVFQMLKLAISQNDVTELFWLFFFLSLFLCIYFAWLWHFGDTLTINSVLLFFLLFDITDCQRWAKIQNALI